MSEEYGYTLNQDIMRPLLQAALLTAMSEQTPIGLIKDVTGEILQSIEESLEHYCPEDYIPPEVRKDIKESNEEYEKIIKKLKKENKQIISMLALYEEKAKPRKK